MSVSFRTKVGHAEVTSEELTLVKSGARGRASEAIQGRGRGRILIIYGVLVLIISVGSVSAFLRGRVGEGAAFAAVALYVAVTLLRSRNFSVASVVPRGKTTRVEFVTGWFGLTRDRVIVHFEEDGRPARRFVMLPGVLGRGAGELERAKTALQSAGWPLDGGSAPSAF